MQVVVNENDTEGKRNIAALLGLYDEMINGKKPLEATRKYLVADYIQHNPLLPTGGDGTGLAFQERLKNFPNMQVKVHRIFAIKDYVWAHVNFINIYSNDENDLGIAGVDIFKFNSEGKITEHWDVLQPVVPPAKASNENGMF